MARLEDLSVEEIRKRYVESPEPVSAQVLTRLQKDSRLGVKKLLAVLKKRHERERDERLRLDAMRHFELVLWKSGVTDVAGVDEAGVAPLAGPVVAAAVMFPPGADIAGINDSKQVDPEMREALAKEIRAKASGVAVGIATVEDIDRINIFQARMVGMRRTLERIGVPVAEARIDGNHLPPGLTCTARAIIDGDALDRAIAAASILAKVERDRIMTELDAVHPGYGFASHKGYSTPEHFAALQKLGPSPIHRRSFEPVRRLLQPELALFVPGPETLPEPA